MHQSNVIQRQQSKKTGNRMGKEPAHTKTESNSSSGEKYTAEATNLPDLFVEQAQSLTTFISNALDNAINPTQGHLNHG